MRYLGTVAVALALSACSTSRGAAMGRAGVPPTADAPAPGFASTPGPMSPGPMSPMPGPMAGAPVARAGGATDAVSLAQETGLGYDDDGRTVLLSSVDVRARLYPATGTLTIDGRGVSMGAPVRREGAVVVVPAAGADAVRQAVRQASLRRTSAPRPLALTPLPPLAPIARPALKPVELVPAPAREVPGDPAWVPAVAARNWRWIVVHHSDDHSGCFAKYDRVHRAKGWDGCGYHFVIGNGTESGDGQIEVTDRWHEQTHGAHAKTDDNRFNDFGVGIVLVGDFERGGQPTERQYRSLVRLTRWLMARYGVTPDRVLRHSDCKSTACPGRNFPWSRFLGDVADAASVASPP